MKLPPTNCPVCNAMGRFSPKERRFGDLIYIYTRCVTCRSEFPIETITAAEQKARERTAREHRSQIRKTGARLRSVRVPRP